MRPDEHRRLVKIVALLASSNAGERASAAHRATKLLQRHGLSWADALGGIAVDETPDEDGELFVLDELGMARSDLAVSEALREKLHDELDEVKTRLGD